MRLMVSRAVGSNALPASQIRYSKAGSSTHIQQHHSPLTTTHHSTTHHSPPLTHTPSPPTQIFTNRLTLSAHLRICTGGKWECEWCGCKETETPSKAGGPSGPKTLCNACGSRFRAGHTSMPKKDEEGR